MYEHHNLVLLKAENPEAYKKLAEQGVMVAHPVSIQGRPSRPDIGIDYHSTVKFFNPEKDSSTAIHGVARDLKFTPPDPETTGIEPSVFKDRFGNDVHVIKLHGDHAEQIKANNAKFSHMGFPASYEFTPHISVDKGTWDGIVQSGAKTAKEAGISFGHAQLRQGHQVLTTYKHGSTKPAAQEEKKLAASEKMEMTLNKGMKHVATAAAMAAAIGLGSPVNEAKPATKIAEQKSDYSSDRMLRSISDVESSGGKFANHRMLGGMHHGESAYGKYGLTPVVIRETIAMHPDLKGKYSKAQTLEGTDLNHYMQDNPGLEDKVAQKHLSRLEHHFGKDPAKIGYAWLEGITGAHKAIKENTDIQNHWHVKKVKDAYGRQK